VQKESAAGHGLPRECQSEEVLHGPDRRLEVGIAQFQLTVFSLDLETSGKAVGPCANKSGYDPGFQLVFQGSPLAGIGEELPHRRFPNGEAEVERRTVAGGRTDEQVKALLQASCQRLVEAPEEEAYARDRETQRVFSVLHVGASCPRLLPTGKHGSGLFDTYGERFLESALTRRDRFTA
jgi:hypothetical protein